MNFVRIHTRAILIATAFALAVIVMSMAVYMSLGSWRKEVIRTNKTLTKLVVEQLHAAANPLVDSLAREGVFDSPSLSVDDAGLLDERLKRLSDSVFTPIIGMEGGFFLVDFDEFYGYSYPTSPPPVPAYGPPPRSYNFIKDQVLETAESGTPMVELHQFDPAIFPLATEPVFVDGDPRVVLWARTHIERELPGIKLRQVVNIGAAVSLLGFVIAMLISITQYRKIQKMSQELGLVKSGDVLQIDEGKGTLGVIARSINAMVLTMRSDSSRREQLERELHQKEKMASLGKVIAGVAHEVKTPLAIIKTRIQMWQQAIREAKDGTSIHNVCSNESLQLVVEEVDRLSTLVKHLLLFSKPQPGGIAPTDINDLLEQTISFSEARRRMQNIEIKYDLDPHLPHVPADRNALRQVFMNTVMNSAEAIPDKGKITVATHYDPVHKLCRVSISDDGVGVPDEMRESVFDPFVTTKKKGFGLGLSISYEIIAAHNGRIELHPNEDAGTTCIIELPSTSGHEGNPDR